MGKVIKNKIQGMSWWMKTSLVLLLTLTSMLFMYEGWYKPKQVQAGITTLQNETNIYHNLALPGATAASFAVNAGTNRMLVVTLAYSASSSSALTATSVTYGGAAMTAAGGDAALRQPAQGPPIIRRCADEQVARAGLEAELLGEGRAGVSRGHDDLMLR